MMRYLALFAVLAASVSGILLYLYCRHERQKELYRMEMLRSTKLYKNLHAALVSCRADSRDLDQVRIERDRITLTLVDPPHVLIQFDLHQAGFAKMSRVRTRVMAEVLAEDISILLDRSKYSLQRYRLMRPNGSWDYGYLYTVTIPYKDSINTARARLRARI